MNKMSTKRYTVSISENENGGSVVETQRYATLEEACEFTFKRLESWAAERGLVGGLEEAERDDIRRHLAVRGRWIEDGSEPSEIWITIKGNQAEASSKGFADIEYDLRDETQHRLEDQALAQEDAE